jgi:hypothetical protein
VGHFPAAANQRRRAPVLDLSLLCSERVILAHPPPPGLDSAVSALLCTLHCTRLCTLHCTRLCTLRSPNPLASRSSLQPPPLFASTHTFVACFHARRPVAVPSSSAPAKLLDVVSARHVPWLCPLLPCVCGCTRPTRHLTSSATPLPSPVPAHKTRPGQRSQNSLHQGLFGTNPITAN